MSTATVHIPRIAVERATDRIPGLALARACIAMINGKILDQDATVFAANRWPDEPHVHKLVDGLMIRTVVAPGTSTDSAWAGPLAVLQPALDEFLAVLRPLTIIGRLAGLVRAPLNTSVPVGGGFASSASWLGQAGTLPVTQGSLTSAALQAYFMGKIVVITKQLVQLATLDAEMTVRQELVNQLREFSDRQFVDANAALIANVQPASITNGVTGITPSGTTEAAFKTDMKALIKSLKTAGYPLAQCALIISDDMAAVFSLNGGAGVQTSLTVEGGNLAGIPAVASSAVADIVLAHLPSILMSDGNEMQISVTQQASVQMDDAPTAPPVAATILESLWQRNWVGVRVVRPISWLKARATAVNKINAPAYA